jgi:hypothetical protein
VDGADVVKLRKALGKQGGGAKNGLDPTIPVSAQDRTAVRNLATDVIRSFLAPAEAQKYSVALAKYDQDYAQPARILRALTNRNTPASDAFKAVYGGSDPTVFQTAIRIAKDRPAFKNRLRLGFLESLNDEAGGFSQGKKAIDLLRNHRATVSATGLFTNPELDALEMALRPGAPGRIAEAVGHIVSRQPRAAVKVLGAEGPIGLAGATAAASHLAGMDPSIVLMAAMAGGAAGALRTIIHTPPGSTASIAAARTVAKAVSDIAAEYGAMDTQDADFGEGSENE